jgi:hypothetical protein
VTPPLDTPSTPLDAGVDAAMARVLAAEHQARASVAAAQDQAARLSEAARVAQRALGQRTRRRMVRVREAFGRHVQQALADLAQQATLQARPDELDADDQARLAWAVQSLAAQLTEPTP